MISTKLHGAIDVGAAGLLGGLALLPRVSPGTRRTLAAAGLYHAGYSSLTEYEAGISGGIGMRQHLALDVLGAAALCGAGLATRRRAPREGTLLLAAGLAELAVVALSNTRVAAPPPGMAYPPLDTPKPVADGIWIVDSVIGPGAPVRMTVVQLPGGGLLLHSPTRLVPALRRELERLGPIRHLVAPNIAHWTFIKAWQDAVPGTTTWAAPGLRGRAQVRRSGLRIDHDLADAAPPEWAAAIDHVLVRGGAGFAEVAMFHRPSRTALLTDLALNIERRKLPWPLRPAAWLLGVVAPDGRAPAYLRALVRLGGRGASRAASRVVAWDPERVILAHGRWIERDGGRYLRQSLGWLLA